jgi:hypothetical protein
VDRRRDRLIINGPSGAVPDWRICTIVAGFVQPGRHASLLARNLAGREFVCAILWLRGCGTVLWQNVVLDDCEIVRGLVAELLLLYRR